MLRAHRFITIVVMLLLALGSTQAYAQMTELNVQLKWKHQTQFAGFYAADQLGYYADSGLKVSFTPAGPPTDIIGNVTSGQSQVGIAGADQIIEAYSKGEPLKALGVTYQKNPLVFVAPKSSGITSVQDFRGKTARVVPTQMLVFKAMLHTAGLTIDDVNIVSLPSDYEVFQKSDAQIWGAYLSGFVAKLQDEGVELNIFFPDHYKVHFYMDTIFTTESFLNANRDVLKRFLAATYKGWQWSIENPRKAAEMVRKYDPSSNVDVELKRMTAQIPLIGAGNEHLGHMSLEVWESMARDMQRQGLIEGATQVPPLFDAALLTDLFGHKIGQ